MMTQDKKSQIVTDFIKTLFDEGITLVEVLEIAHTNEFVNQAIEYASEKLQEKQTI